MSKIPKMNPDYQAEVLDHSSHSVEDLMGTKGPYESGTMGKSKKGKSKKGKKKSKKAY